MMALTVTLVVALATSGFAHRVMTPDDQALQQLALTLGLDAADICGDTGGASNESCEACRLHAAMNVPLPAGVSVVLELGIDLADWVPEPQRLNDLTGHSPHHARGPPTV